MNEPNETSDIQLREAVSQLLPPIAQGSFELRQLEGGRNNRVFRIDTPRKPYLLKQYFTHRSDSRDRQLAEDIFLSVCRVNGVHCVPMVVHQDRKNHLTLMEFVEGQRLVGRSVRSEHVDQALAFFRNLNRARAESPTTEPNHFPNASEACFSIEDHLLCVERRVDNLLAIRAESPLHEQARRFIDEDLFPRWEEIRDRTIRKADDGGLDRRRALEDLERCISPSDFGFHNAILQPDGRLRFIDFEYAGFDDPAKMVCDFFCQVEVPVPREELPRFVDSVAETVALPDAFRLRTELLMPVYQVKWCCIVLNDFLPTDAARRAFSALETSRERQLTLARQLWSELPRW